MRRNILTQVISEDTKRHIQLEENEILEKTGFGVEIEKLIDMAKKYEVFHNKVPTRDVATAFQVASGGFTCNPEHIKLENQALKRKDYTDRKNMTELVHEVLQSYSTRLNRADQKIDQMREARRSSQIQNQRDSRQSSFDRQRGITPEPSPTRVTYKPQSTPPRLPNSIQRRREERSRSRERQRPYSPPRIENQRDKYQQDRRIERDQYYKTPRDNNGYRNYSYGPQRQGYYSNRYDSRDRGYSRTRSPSPYRSRNQSLDRPSGRYRSPSPYRQSNSSNDRGRSPYRHQADSRPISRSRSREYDRDQSYGPPSFDKSVMVHINRTEMGN